MSEISSKLLNLKSINSRALVYGLLIMTLYMVARFFVYSTYPAFTYNEWLQRDFVMTIPRFVGFVLSFLVLLFMFPNVSVLRVGRFKHYVWGFILFAALLWSETKNSVVREPGIVLVAIFTLTSMVVGFFEEYLFRGIIYESLGANSFAIIFSSALFAYYHVQAQPSFRFPELFLYGLVFAMLRANGFKLFSLAVLHGLYDSFFIALKPSREVFQMSLHYTFLILAVAFLYYKYLSLNRVKQH